MDALAASRGEEGEGAMSPNRRMSNTVRPRERRAAFRRPSEAGPRYPQAESERLCDVSIGRVPHPKWRALGTPDEVAEVICFLASDAASFATAAVWSVDGGYVAQ